MDVVQARAELRKRIIDSFDESEVKSLCFDLGIDYDSLSNKSKSETVMALISAVQRRTRMRALLTECMKQRPNVQWDDLAAVLLQDESAESQCRPEVIYFCMSQSYGVGYDEMRVSCNISSDGSAIVQRTVRVKAYSHIGELDTFLLTPEPEPPNTPRRDFGFLAIRSLTKEREVDLVRPKDQPGSRSCIVRISEPLEKGQELTYELVEKVPSGLYAMNLTEEVLRSRTTPYDYFGWNINRPTAKLSLDVSFPSNIKPEVYDREVRFASTSPGLPSETRQLEQEGSLDRPDLLNPKRDNWQLRLEIDYPMIGLIYVVRWQPIPKVVKPQK
jgi:hypothetical protein